MAALWQPLNQTTWPQSLRRIIISGAPYAGKSTSLLSFPAPRHVLVVPGEKGASSLPADDPDTKVYVWDEKADPAALLVDFKRTALEVAAGKHGAVGLLAVDGGHIYADLVMRCLGWSPDLLDSKDGARQYPKYYHEIRSFFAQLSGSEVPYFVLTCYDGREQAEDVTGARVVGQTQVWPEMPGKLAKLIMGSFGCAFHQEKQPGNPVDLYHWRLKPLGQMVAAGMHIPAKLLSRFPASIPILVNPQTGEVTGGWQTIERIISEATAGKQHVQ